MKAQDISETFMHAVSYMIICLSYKTYQFRYMKLVESEGMLQFSNLCNLCV